MLPEVVVHSLISVDGKIEGFGEEAIGHYYQVSGQLEADAWLIGSDTLVEAENQPEATVRQEDRDHEPLRDIVDDERLLIVVPDSKGRVRHWASHVEWLGARGAVVLVSSTTPQESRAYFQTRNIPMIEAGKEQVDYHHAFASLVSDFGVRKLRTDSGGVLNNILLKEGLVSELSLIIAPELVGQEARDLFRTLEPKSKLSLHLMDCQRLGSDFIWLRYRVGSR